MEGNSIGTRRVRLPSLGRRRTCGAGPRARDAWFLVRVLVTVAVAIAFGPSASVAEAYTGPRLGASPEHLDSTTRHLYRGSPITGVDTSAAEGMRAEELRAVTSQPSSQALHAELQALRETEGLAPKFGRIGTVGLAVTAGYVGWKIGGAINAKYLRFNLPPLGAPPGISAVSLVPVDRGSPILSGYPAAPQDMWLALWTASSWTSGSQQKYEFNTGFPEADPDCAVSQYRTPQPLAGYDLALSLAAPDNVCAPLAIGRRAAAITSPVRPGALEDYTDQPVTKATPAPADPGFSLTKDATAAALNRDGGNDYPTLNAWYDFQFGAPGACDPVNPTHCNAPDCTHLTFEECDQKARDVGFGRITRVETSEYDPAYPPGAVMRTDPASGEHGRTEDEFKIYVNARQRCEPTLPTNAYTQSEAGLNAYSPFEGFADQDWGNPTFSTPLNPNPDRRETVLRWGSTASVTRDEGFWDGWGYRHIAAKHGWGETDAKETRAVLTTGPVVEPDPGDASQRTEYRAAVDREDLRYGIPCRRVVVVEYGPRSPGDLPRGIATSYAQPIP